MRTRSLTHRNDSSRKTTLVRKDSLKRQVYLVVSIDVHIDVFFGQGRFRWFRRHDAFDIDDVVFVLVTFRPFTDVIDRERLLFIQRLFPPIIAGRIRILSTGKQLADFDRFDRLRRWSGCARGSTAFLFGVILIAHHGSDMGRTLLCLGLLRYR